MAVTTYLEEGQEDDSYTIIYTRLSMTPKLGVNIAISIYLAVYVHVTISDKNPCV